MNRDLDVKRAVLEEYDNGAKATVIAEKYGISRGTIYLWIDQRKKGKLTFDDRVINNAIRKFNEEHWSVKEIASHFGVSVPTVYAWLKMKDIPLDETRKLEFDDVVVETDTTKDQLLIDALNKEINGLKEQNKKLREEVELYKGLLSKLNTLIDKTTGQ